MRRLWLRHATVVALVAFVLGVSAHSAMASTIVNATTSGAFSNTVSDGINITFSGAGEAGGPAALSANLGPDVFLPFGTFHVSGVTNASQNYSSDFTLTVTQTDPTDANGAIPGTIKGTIVKSGPNTLLFTVTGGSLVLDGPSPELGIQYTMFDTNIGSGGSGASFDAEVYGKVAAVPLPAAAWGGIALFGLLGGNKLRRMRQLSNPL